MWKKFALHLALRTRGDGLEATSPWKRRTAVRYCKHQWQRLLRTLFFPVSAEPVFKYSVQVTPWMENGNLGAYVKRSFSVDRLKSLSEVAAGTYSCHEGSLWMLEFPLGLEYLHIEGIVHGDLRGVSLSGLTQHDNDWQESRLMSLFQKTASLASRILVCLSSSKT